MTSVFLFSTSTNESAPPQGVISLATVLGMWHGVDVDVAVNPGGIPSGYDVVGGSSLTVDVEQAYQLLDDYDDYSFLGGPHVSVLPQEALTHSDCVIVGEGEEIVGDVVSGRREGILQGPVVDIDKLPTPDYTLLPNIDDFLKRRGKPFGVQRALSTSLNRNCPFSWLRGGTLVNTIYGMLPIKEIAENYEKIPIYTYDFEKREVLIADAFNPTRTRKNAKLVRVHFDDGTHIDCTPDHLFATFKNGNQKSKTIDYETQAQNLKEKTSVRAIKKEDGQTGGYVSIIWGRRKRRDEHRLVMDYVLGRKLGRKEYVHHVDGNVKNNHPSNLEYVATQKEHVAKHPEIAERMKRDNPCKYCTPESREKIRKAITGKKRTIKQRERYSQSKMGKKNPNYRHGKKTGGISRLVEQKTKTPIEVRLKLRESKLGEKNPNYKHGGKRVKKSRVINHKIVFVEELDERADVYCMEVPGYNWFFANNVLVHNCAFCQPLLNTVFGRKMKLRHPKLIHQDITTYKNNLNIQAISLQDDTLTLSKPHLHAICSAMLKNRLTWTANSRVDTITQKDMNHMKKCGCTRISFGIESANDHIRNDVLKKGITKQQIRNTITAAKKEGIGTQGFFMLGAPGETPETLQETADFIDELRLDSNQVTVYTSQPGCALYDGRKHGGSWSNYNYYDKCLTPPSDSLSCEDVEAFHEKLKGRLEWRAGAHRLMNIRSFTDITYLGKAFVRRIRR